MAAMLPEITRRSDDTPLRGMEDDTGDRPFTSDAWTENLVFDHIRQSYMLTSKSMLSTVRETEGLDAHTAQKADFYLL